MKKILLATLLISSCGYTSRDSELIGQPKKVINRTPLICPDYVVVDVSMGVMRNGVGSMSKEDIWLTVPDKDLKETLVDAVSKGALVKITYDEKRITWCIEDHIVTNVEIVNQ